MTFRVLYLSENIFATVQNLLVFSVIRLNEASKRPTLRAIISQTVGDTAKVYGVSIGNPCVPIGSIARI